MLGSLHPQGEKLLYKPGKGAFYSTGAPSLTKSSGSVFELQWSPTSTLIRMVSSVPALVLLRPKPLF
jgi:hypothetical protein